VGVAWGFIRAVSASDQILPLVWCKIKFMKELEWRSEGGVETHSVLLGRVYWLSSCDSGCEGALPFAERGA